MNIFQKDEVIDWLNLAKEIIPKNPENAIRCVNRAIRKIEKYKPHNNDDEKYIYFEGKNGGAVMIPEEEFKKLYNNEWMEAGE